jgi:hypothetical protein
LLLLLGTIAVSGEYLPPGRAHESGKTVSRK